MKNKNYIVKQYEIFPGFPLFQLTKNSLNNQKLKKL